MLLDFNSIKYSQSDCDLITDNVNEIVQLGLKAFKRKHNNELTSTESALLNIFIENSCTYLSRDQITAKYNKLVYKSQKHKYIDSYNIVTKISRVNKKLKGMKIINKYSYGYILLIV